MSTPFGPIVLMGSGETSLAGGRIFESIARRYTGPVRVAVLETPAGFELNSSQVAGRVADYLKIRLQNHSARIQVVPARRKDGPFSTDDPTVLTALMQADLIFMGPGSPSFAVRQLRGSLAWDLLRARHRQGAALVFASAATVAVGARSLPVYEIYKVGQDVSCPAGLDLFADFGLSLSCVPHWNNTDGGADVDTSRCFIGMERFAQWCAMLPAGSTLLGLDEHTGLIIDFSDGNCSVSGVSSVTLLHDCEPRIFPAGASFPVTELGEVRLPDEAGEDLPAAVWSAIRTADQVVEPEPIPDQVLGLVEARQQARLARDWSEADRIREQLAVLGWMVQDGADGQKLIRRT